MRKNEQRNVTCIWECKNADRRAEDLPLKNVQISRIEASLRELTEGKKETACFLQNAWQNEKLAKSLPGIIHLFHAPCSSNNNGLEKEEWEEEGEEFDKVLQTEIFLHNVCRNFLHWSRRNNRTRREEARKHN